ncbi:signal peptide-containing protein [Cryptosporidium canis]|uniref:Signal peptide-containing protein n=1 Tax=Cryptosporidium canis TaxID=195482 RepID=A0A9D5HW68_9CRYT|nr:signal peptide-containing protein [Cryptosporidium canis]
MKRSVGITSLIALVYLLVGAESQPPRESHVRRKVRGTRLEMTAEESSLLECTEALNSWSYFAKTSMQKLLDDDYKKKEYIYFLGTLTPQIETIDDSFNRCKNELSKLNILAKSETSQFKVDLKSRGEKEMEFNSKETVSEALIRIMELKERNEQINEAKRLILGFDPNSMCKECRLFSSQMALISVLKRLRLMYNSYITDMEAKIDIKILDEMEEGPSSPEETTTKAEGGLKTEQPNQ